MWRLAVLLAVGCGRQINPEWCAQPGHVDPACGLASDAATDTSAAIDTLAPIDASASIDAVDPALALHASPAGTGTACTVDAPCSFATAIAEANGARTVIVLAAGVYHGAIIVNRSVQIVGNKDVTLDASGTGSALTITSGATVELTAVKLTGATGASGLSCVSGTLRAARLTISGNQHGVTSACALSLERSVIARNRDGALAVTAGSIDIHDNFFVNNGNEALVPPNVTLGAGITGSFAFNTVAYNDAKQNADPGLDCQSAVLTLPGNLITDNTRRGVFNVAPQVTGVCDLSGSYTAPGAGANDLGWVDIASNNFHLTAASTAALDRPDLACARRVDFDGDPRPSGGGCDLGADELTASP